MPGSAGSTRRAGLGFKTLIAGLRVWLRLLFKVFFTQKKYINNIFFIFLKLYLRSAN
jgi:hypothetical protein